MAVVPDAQAVDTVWHGPLKPKRSERCAATELGMAIGMASGLMPRRLPSSSIVTWRSTSTATP